MFDFTGEKREFKDKAKEIKAESAPNMTGIPDTIKTRFENQSGLSFDDVRVHYNSEKPAQLQALAYTKGNQVYVGPGQEKHLGHELGHVVQQKEGKVKASRIVDGIPLNDDPSLEHEADAFLSGTPVQRKVAPARKLNSLGVVQRLILTSGFFKHHINATIDKTMFDRDGAPAVARNTIINHNADTVKKHVKERRKETGVNIAKPDVDFNCTTYRPDTANDNRPLQQPAQSGWRKVAVCVAGETVYHLDNTTDGGSQENFNARETNATAHEQAEQQARITLAEQAKEDEKLGAKIDAIYTGVFGKSIPEKKLYDKRKDQIAQAKELATKHCAVVEAYNAFNATLNNFIPNSKMPKNFEPETMKATYENIVFQAYKSCAIAAGYDDAKLTETDFDALKKKVESDDSMCDYDADDYVTFIANKATLDDAFAQLYQIALELDTVTEPAGLLEMARDGANEQAFIYWLNHADVAPSH